MTVNMQTVKEINFQDTHPNHIYFANNSAYNVYVSISPLVSDSIFDMIIPPYATKLWARAEGTHQVYAANVSTIGNAHMTVISFEAEFDPRSLPQTQEIVGASAAGLLGVIDVQQIVTALPAGNNKIGNVGLADALPEGNNNIGFVKIGGSIPSGTNHIGNVRIDAGSAKIGQIVIVPEAADNGMKAHRLISAATINATSVKAAAGSLTGILISNTGTVTVFFKLYNKAAAPDPASDVPVMTIPVRSEETINIQLVKDLYFSAGIAYAITADAGDTDTTAITADEVFVNLMYV